MGGWEVGQAGQEILSRLWVPTWTPQRDAHCAGCPGG